MTGGSINNSLTSYTRAIHSQPTFVAILSSRSSRKPKRSTAVWDTNAMNHSLNWKFPIRFTRLNIIELFRQLAWKPRRTCEWSVGYPMPIILILLGLKQRCLGLEDQFVHTPSCQADRKLWKIMWSLGPAIVAFHDWTQVFFVEFVGIPILYWTQLSFTIVGVD